MIEPGFTFTAYPDLKLAGVTIAQDVECEVDVDARIEDGDPAFFVSKITFVDGNKRVRLTGDHVPIPESRRVLWALLVPEIERLPGFSEGCDEFCRDNDIRPFDPNAEYGLTAAALGVGRAA